jgi:putative flippase GtrA
MRKKFFRFILVGILNTLFGYLLYALFIFLKMHYAQAVLLATIIGALFNFKTIGALVFKNSDNRLIFRFLSVYLVTYLFNVVALKGFARIGFNMYLAGLLVAFPAALISFVLQNFLVFGNKTADVR